MWRGMVLALLLMQAWVGANAGETGPGFTCVVAPATPEFPRNTEGSIVELRDGRLLLAWSRFRGGTADASTADIAGSVSGDGGRTWGKAFVIQQNVGRQNVMSASLLRLKSGKIALFYLVKNSSTDLHLWMRHSEDEGKTWGDAARVTADAGYNIVNNDRVVRLAGGRLIAPVSYSADIGKPGSPLTCFVFYSDDEGKTWRKSSPRLEGPMRGAMEPGVVELADGTLLMIIRTQTGRIHESRSSDQGSTWQPAEQTNVISPEAPASIARIPGSPDLLLVWNNNPKAAIDFRAPRTPLAAAISMDGGRTWKHPRNIETDPARTFAYTSIAFVRDRVLLTYYETADWGKGLSLRFRSIPLEWFYGR